MNAPKQVIHLFSSNMRQLYIQNCANLLALPKGAKLRFRYSEDHLNIPSLWTSKLRDVDVFTYFVAADQKTPSTVLIVPLRVCRLVETTRKDKFCFLDFEIGDYLDISDVADFLELNDIDMADKGYEETSVADFTAKLQEKLNNIPHKRKVGGIWKLQGDFAIIRNDESGLPTHTNQITEERKFIRTAEFLLDITGQKGKFSPKYKIQDLYQISEVTEIGKDFNKSVTYDKGFIFESNNRYAIDILQVKSNTPSAPSLKFEIPEMLNATTPQEVYFASNYDSVRFEFVANPRDDKSHSYISFIGRFDPVRDVADGLIFPRITLPITVIPPVELTRETKKAICGSSVIAGLLAFSSSRNFTLFSNWRHVHFGDLRPYEWVQWLINHSPTAVVTGFAATAAYTTANFAFKRRSIGLKG
jgi:hypothetical protein